MDAWYSRYEISNFALIGKSSIHNRVYWEMESYLGVGLNASSFFNERDINSEIMKNLWISSIGSGVRFKDTVNIKEYFEWKFIDKNEIQILSEKDKKIESFFLGLRTDRGVDKILNYKDILVPKYDEKLLRYQDEGLLIYEWNRLILTDAWMDVFNTLVTDIMQEI